jgi:AcrR family transcriptional regulator
MTDFQRARSPEAKRQRREAILRAARDQAMRDGVRGVSLRDIAGQVGIDKSALLRYFETREEIYLVLTAEAWRDWEAGTIADLRSVHDAEEVARVLADSFASRPLFCDLLVHTPLNLERQVSVDAVRRYKRQSLGSVHAVAEALYGALPARTLTQCRELVATLATMAGSLWQIANPPAPLAQLYASDAEFLDACVEVAPTLRRVATVLLAGFAAGQ